MSSGWDSATDTTTGDSSSTSPRPLISSLQPAAMNITVIPPNSSPHQQSGGGSTAAYMAAVREDVSASAQRRRMQRRHKHHRRSPSPPTSPERGRSNSRSRRSDLPPATDIQRLFHSDPRTQRRQVHAPSFSTVAGSGQFYRPPSATAEPQHQQHTTFSELLEAMISSCGGEWHHSQSGGGNSPGSIFHPRRLEKVKFGVSVDEVCQRCNGELPASLLILLLKLNKQGPHRKDVFRAPGHQASVKSLIGFLQQGRLVNIDNFSVYTLASVLKKFLRKLPGGVFGAQNEIALAALEDKKHAIDPEIKREHVKQIIRSLSMPTQRLLVLLFGTFSIIALYAESGAVYDVLASPSTSSNSVKPAHGWAAQALGVSVAPSLFVSLVDTGKQVKREDIQQFKVASDSIAFLIRNFSTGNIFGRENYEYYAHMTGRVLRVDDEWIFTFPFPLERQQVLRDKFMAKNICLAQLEAIKWGIGDTVNSPSDPYRAALMPSTPSTTMLTSSATIDNFDSAEPTTHSAPRLRCASSSIHSHRSQVHAPHAAANLSPLRKRVLNNNNNNSLQRFSAQSDDVDNINVYADQNIPPIIAYNSPSASLASGLAEKPQTSLKSPCGKSGTSSSSATLTHSTSNSNGSTLIQSSTTTSTSSSSNNSRRRKIESFESADFSSRVNKRQTSSKKRLSDNVTSARQHAIYDIVYDAEVGGIPYSGESPQYRQYKSYMSLPEIEERQKQMLAARSQWFLGGIGGGGKLMYCSAREAGGKRSTHLLGEIFPENVPGVVLSTSTSAQSSPRNSAMQQQNKTASAGRGEKSLNLLPNDYYLYHRYNDENAQKRQSTFEAVPVQAGSSNSSFHSFTTPESSGQPPQQQASSPFFVSTAKVKLFPTGISSGSNSNINNKKPRDDSDSSTAEPLSSFEQHEIDSVGKNWSNERISQVQSLRSAAGYLAINDELEGGSLMMKRSPKRRPQLSPLILQLQRSLGAAVTGESGVAIQQQQQPQQSTGISWSPSCVTFSNAPSTLVQKNRSHVPTAVGNMPSSVSAYAVADAHMGNTRSSSSHVAAARSKKLTMTTTTISTASNTVNTMSSSSASSNAMSEADDDNDASGVARGISARVVAQSSNVRPFNYLNPSGSFSIASQAAPEPQHFQYVEESLSLQNSPSGLLRGSSFRRGGRAARLLPATAGPSSRPVAVDVIRGMPAAAELPPRETVAAQPHQAAQLRAARFRAPLMPSGESTSPSHVSNVAQQQQRVARVLPLNEQHQQHQPGLTLPTAHSNTDSPQRVRYVPPPPPLSTTTSPARYAANK